MDVNNFLNDEDTEEANSVVGDPYYERNMLVSLLASLYPSGRKKTDIEGWSPEWHNCVYIDLPNGQASWHYHDREAHLFDHLPEYVGEYDGHSTEAKYQRILELAGVPREKDEASREEGRQQG